MPKQAKYGLADGGVKKHGLMFQRVAAEVEDMVKRYQLKPWHIELAREFAKPKGLRMCREDIQDKLGITHDQYYYWRNHPVIRRVRMEMTRLYFFDDIPDVIMAMRNKALKGDTQAASLFWEMVLEIKMHDADNPTRPPYYQPRELNVYLIQIRQKYNLPIPKEMQEMANAAKEEDLSTPEPATAGA